ncbi:MAG: hypothetical protein ACYS21_08830 [Planctomycetota bacterium]|jgi:hypothetical protein
MNENQDKQENLLDTTDCLEAVGVFRAWKNGLFVITVLCLVVLQILFWAVNLELVGIEQVKLVPPAAVPAPEVGEPNAAALKSDEISRAAREVTTDANLAQVNEPLGRAAEYMKMEGLPAYEAKSKHLASLTRLLIRLLDFVLILAAILYCLTMLFCLKISLLGRLGGINHISRAFFLSLAFVVLLLPWQKLFGPTVKGAIYTPAELISWLNWHQDPAGGIFATALHYLRFTGYWLVVLLLAVFAQVRSGRWAKATLRRLEII